MSAQPSSNAVPLVRRMLQPDEWSETYLADIVRGHGVPRPWRNHLDVIRGSLPSTASAGGWRPVASGGGTSGAMRVDAVPRYGGFALPGWAASDRSGRIRYCPLCIAEQRYIRARWRIHVLPLCTLHGCLFKDDLVEPAVTVGYSEPGRLRLAEATIDDLLVGASCSTEGTLVATRVWSDFEARAQQSETPSTDQELALSLACSLLLWRCLTAMATVHRRQIAKQQMVSAVADVHQMVGALGLIIDPTQEGITRLLRQVDSKTHLLAAARALERSFDEEARGPTVLSLLPVQEFYQVALAAEPGLRIATKPGAIAFRLEKESYCSRNEAMDRLGVNDQTLDAWVKRGWISDVQERRLGLKRFVFLSRAQVDSLRQRMSQLIPVERFIEEVAIDWSSYFALRRCGVLRPVVMGDVRHLVRQEVTAIQLLLENASMPPRHPDAGAIPLLAERTIKAAGGQLAFGEVLKGVLDGRIPMTRTLDLPGWSAFRLPTQALPALTHTRRGSWARRQALLNVGQADLFVETLCSA